MTTIAQDLGGVVLLPCPFCGAEAAAESYVIEAAVFCTGCRAKIIRSHGARDDNGYPEAIAAWNTRTHSAEIAGALRDAERYRWLRMMAKEQLLNPKAAGSEWPDMRTYWRIPTLICSGPVGGFIDFDAAIDAAMQQGGGGGE